MAIHHHEERSCNGSCDNKAMEEERGTLRPLIISLVLLAIVILLRETTGWWGIEWLQTLFFLFAFLPVGWPVILEGIELIRREHSYFNECTLMTVAAIGAFAIGEQTEAVLLMLLYQFGEYLEDKAINRARNSISDLIDVRSDTVQLIQGEVSKEIPAKEAKVGDRIKVFAGMRVALDGTLLSEEGLLNQSALTGESMLVECEEGDVVLAGSLVEGKPIEVLVNKPFEESTLARILQQAEEAAEHKPKTEHFIRRFAKVYTPIVFVLALLVVAIPGIIFLFHTGYSYNFADWLYRGLVFLVVSCPCAVVISVPLSYFCGLGAASKHGLLLRGAAHLEELNHTTAVVFDKTGTLTIGAFKVAEVKLASDTSEQEAMAYLLALEQQSHHPMAQAIQHYAKDTTPAEVTDLEEVTGMGLMAKSMREEEILVGSEKMMLRRGIQIPQDLSSRGKSAVHLSINGEIKATVILQDTIKKSSKATIDKLKEQGIKEIVMLSGDRPDVVKETAQELGIPEAFGGLLPNDKMEKVEQLLPYHSVAFVGDGLNDAPVMRICQVGIAMGGIASDATIEAADIVIQGNNPFKVPQAIDIARYTRRIVLQNIIFALGFKLLVMVLAVFGIASIALAVIADVGVTLIAVLNSLRALKHKAPLE